MKDQTILCKHNSGFCKYRDKCHFRHVQNVCQSETCCREECSARHPNKCKYFARKRCKFGNRCQFSHDTIGKEEERHKVVHEEIESLKKQVEELKEENIELKIDIEERKKELEIAKSNQLKTEKELFKVQEVNRFLLEDV